MAGEKTIYDFTLETLQGDALPLRAFEGRPLVIVNTASQCGFTYQYKGLQQLWSDRKDDGLVVIGFPSNDFGRQEPGKASEIAQFCEVNFGVDFPLAAKTPVTGPDAHPAFRHLVSEGGFLARPRWNFYKYVLGRDGRLRDWFSPLTRPDSARFKAAVDRAIGG